MAKQTKTYREFGSGNEFWIVSSFLMGGLATVCLVVLGVGIVQSESVMQGAAAQKRKLSGLEGKLKTFDDTINLIDQKKTELDAIEAQMETEKTALETALNEAKTLKGAAKKTKIAELKAANQEKISQYETQIEAGKTELKELRDRLFKRKPSGSATTPALKTPTELRKGPPPPDSGAVNNNAPAAVAPEVPAERAPDAVEGSN